MITNGVNDNGVYWVKDNDTYICTYYFGDGVELIKEFKDITQIEIDKLTFEDLKEN